MACSLSRSKTPDITVTTASQFEKHNLQWVSVGWDDNTRSKFSSLGPKISDWTLMLKNGTLLKFLRRPNFTDETLSIHAKDLAITVETPDGHLKAITFAKYLKEFGKWTPGIPDHIDMSNGDNEVVTMRFVGMVVPIDDSGTQEVVPTAYSYQTTSKSDPSSIIGASFHMGTGVHLDGPRTEKVWLVQSKSPRETLNKKEYSSPKCKEYVDEEEDDEDWGDADFSPEAIAKRESAGKAISEPAERIIDAAEKAAEIKDTIKRDCVIDEDGWPNSLSPHIKEAFIRWEPSCKNFTTTLQTISKDASLGYPLSCFKERGESEISGITNSDIVELAKILYNVTCSTSQYWLTDDGHLSDDYYRWERGSKMEELKYDSSVASNRTYENTWFRITDSEFETEEQKKAVGSVMGTRSTGVGRNRAMYFQIPR